MEREKLGSRLGFILLSAGCAIGIGNVWKFPWMAGQYGGGAFVLIYLICLVVMGLPVMVMEFSLGRASQASPIGIHHKLQKPGQKWHWMQFLGIGGNYLLMNLPEARWEARKYLSEVLENITDNNLNYPA